MLHYLKRRKNMDEELISKKELLDETGISYGQLYRWKRKNLIPEDWFIRKATFTGQETFFPRNRILQRVEQIKNLKEDLSLTDLEAMFSSSFTGIIVKKDSILEQNFASQMSLNCFVEKFGDVKEFDFLKILYLFILDKLLNSGKININVGKEILTVLDENYLKFAGRNCDLVLIRKREIPIFLLISYNAEYYFEKDASIIDLININSCIEELKQKLI
jgi:hypothetical protein